MGSCFICEKLGKGSHPLADTAPHPSTRATQSKGRDILCPLWVSPASQFHQVFDDVDNDDENNPVIISQAQEAIERIESFLFYSDTQNHLPLSQVTENVSSESL